MQIDRGSFLIGFVLGLALAAIVISGAVVLAPRGVSAGLNSLTPSPTVSPSPSPTTPAVPTPTPTPQPPPPTPTTGPTSTPSPTPTAPPLRYETVDVPARRYVVFEVLADGPRTLGLTVEVDSDVDLTVLNPAGEVVWGPARVRGSRSLRVGADSGGNWALKLDNSFSWITDKQVLVQYQLLPR